VKIVIIGAGAVGFDLARTVSERDHDVVVIEKSLEILTAAQETLDCRFVHGNGVSPLVLEDVGMKDTDLFAAVSDSDEINIIACLTADHLGARVKVARVRSDEYYAGRRPVFKGITQALNPEHEAAHAIREILFQTAAREVYEFARGQVRIIGSRVSEQSYVAGKSLKDLNRTLGADIALVALIKRGEETLIPHGGTVIQPDDMIYFTGARRHVERSLFFVQSRAEALGRVMIVGASNMGLELARDLIAAGVKVKIIDANEERCRTASEQLHRALILRGEPVDAELLTSEGLDEMDGFVAVTDDEEINILSCLVARHHGARKTVCLVNRPEYVPLLPQLGIDAAVSPRLSTATWIAKFVKRGGVVSAEKLGFTGAEILEYRMLAGNRNIGKPLAKVDFPRGAVIGAVIKRERVETPRGTTVLAQDDKVIVFALPEGVAAVERFFAAGVKPGTEPGRDQNDGTDASRETA